MSKTILEKYIKRVDEEVQLKDNQLEIRQGNVFGSIQGTDFSKMSAQEFYALIKEKMPKMYNAIEAEGGLEALVGKDAIADIEITKTGAIAVTPDK